ncbi:MAG: phosphoribosylanthranilate isomerase [Elusimicrobiota bacterium]|jgi:phosphoribosylanthranilate isomerase|nr:phosphoribosylanthranilate isomerase [Elusimicrobiota bacterium]
MAKIKICGLKRFEDIDYVNEAKPDFAGFVFAGVKRKIDFLRAKELRKRLSPQIKAVGVFVNEPIDNILAAYKDGVFDIVQLHGNEDDLYIDELYSRGIEEIIKAEIVSSAPKVAASRAKYLLFDSGAGSGKTFDWSFAQKMDILQPFFLAGGINEGNVLRAIAETHPYAVDVSGGVETEGLKDRKKIAGIVDMVRKAGK